MGKYKNRLYKRKFTPQIQIGTSGLSAALAAQLVPSETSYVQQLIDLIDDKDVFTAPLASEVGEHVIESVKEVRAMARATRSNVESLELRDLVAEIAEACGRFMRDFSAKYSSTTQAAQFEALRNDTFTAAAALVNACDLPTPRVIPATYMQRGIDLLHEILNDAEHRS